MALDLQAAINATPAGGTLNLTKGEVYGSGRVTRKITINGNGALLNGTGNVLEFAPGSNESYAHHFTAQGPTAANAACVLVRAPDVVLEDITAQDSLQYGIRAYQTDRLTLRRVIVKRAATGIQVHRNGEGNLFEDIRCEQMDRMRVDDGGPGTNGGQGLDFYHTVGTTRVNRLTVIGARAKTRGGVSWPYDGSAVEGYGPCGPVIINGFDFSDCVNICEVGTSSGAGVPTGWVFRGGKAKGNPDPSPGWDRNCEGYFLRANNSFVIEGNEFTDLDDFVINLTSGGQYGGAMGGNLFVANTIRLKPGPSLVYGQNRAYVVSGGVVPTSWGDVSGNRVEFDPAKNPEVGYRQGYGGTKDTAMFRQWTGWSLTGEVWSKPVDPALAACQTELAYAKNEINLLKAEVVLLNGIIDQVHSLTG